jgi:hypothetical protein
MNSLSSVEKLYILFGSTPKGFLLPKSNQERPTVATPTHQKPKTNKNKTNLGHAMLKTKLATQHLLQLEKQQK